MAKRVAKRVAMMMLLAAAVAARGGTTPVESVNKQPDGVLVHLKPGVLRLQVWSDRAIRVTYAGGETLPELKSVSVVGTPQTTKFAVQETGQEVLLKTQSLEARVNKETGAVAFFSSLGEPLLRESDAGRDVSSPPATNPVAPLPPPVRQSFVLPPEEGIFGLGQHQQGIWNYRGHTVRLLQENREVGIPVLLSNKGYVLLWDNPAVTDVSVGAPVSEHAPAHKEAPEPAGENVLRWSSETGAAIDYYFCYGPAPEEAMKQYRELTGPAPLMPRYLWGFWQSKERYRSSDELLEIARKYRELHIPIDGIIQDWRYWPDNTWGSHNFDKSRYPHPAETFSELHDLHYHALISVWPKFDLGTQNIAELEKVGAMYEPAIPYVFPPGKGKWYDPFNPEGRKTYWKQLSSELFTVGVDGWWLDASEPELGGKWGEYRHFKTAAGPGAEVFNAYPLMHSTSVYQGQRAETSDKRVIILTRSAYAGQQRNSAITWSGDISGSWRVFKEQIPAGLNFVASGIPYWNTDIGGFFGSRDAGDSNPQDPRYQELFTRWFQFGSFCPMFRVHGSAPDGGTGPGKDVWRFDDKTQAILKSYLRLRYRLLPYIYSVSWQVTSNGSSMMRPLVMDFPKDPQVANVGDQFLFGPALLVNPVTEKGATMRTVYLPQKSDWYNFDTGSFLAGDRAVQAAAPIETIPLFVRAGSILPLGPLVEYSGEKPDAPLELRVYPGADGDFTLYEDAGDGYQYEKGEYATIPLTWNDKAKTLTIGERKGTFPKMPAKRTFHVVFVHDNHGGGVEPTATPDATLDYTGQPVTATMPG